MWALSVRPSFDLELQHAHVDADLDLPGAVPSRYPTGDEFLGIEGPVPEQIAYVILHLNSPTSSRTAANRNAHLVCNLLHVVGFGKHSATVREGRNGADFGALRQQPAAGIATVSEDATRHRLQRIWPTPPGAETCGGGRL